MAETPETPIEQQTPFGAHVGGIRTQDSADLMPSVGFEAKSAVQSAQKFHDDQAKAAAAPARTLGGTLADAWNSELTMSMASHISRAEAKPDDTYTADRFEEQLKEASKSIPLEILADNIGTVVSAEDFINKVDRIKAQYERQQRLEKDGWTGTAAKVAMGILDPASLVLGMAAGGFAGVVAKSALKARGVTSGLKASASINAINAAAGGIAVVGAKEIYQPISPELSEYLLAAGTGLAIGAVTGKGVFAALSGSSKAALYNTGRKLTKAAEDGRFPGDALPAPPSVRANPIAPDELAEAATPTAARLKTADDLSFRSPAKPLTAANEDTAILKFTGDKARSNVLHGPGSRAAENVVPIGSKAVPPEVSWSHPIANDTSALKAPTGPEAPPTVKLTGKTAAIRQPPSGQLTESAIAALKANVGQDLAPDVEGVVRQLGTAVERQLLPANNNTDPAAVQALLDPPVTHTDLARGVVQHEDIHGGPSGLPDSSAGAKDLGAAEGFVTHQDWAGLGQDDVAKSFAGRLRFDLAGYLGSRKNPVSRILGSILLNDSTGKQGHALNGQAIDLVRVRLQHKMLYRYATASYEAMNEWAKSTGKSFGYMKFQGGFREFHELVGRYVANRKMTDDEVFHPAVQKAGEAARANYKEMLDYFKNPLKDSGLEGRALGEAADLADNPFYQWRRFDARKWNDVIEQFGEAQVVKLVASSIRSAQRDVPEEYIQKLAKGYVNTVHRRNNGDNDTLVSAFSTRNEEALAAILRNHGGIGEDEITDILSKMKNVDNPRTGVSGNLKSKVLMDENFAVEMVSKDGRTVRSMRFHELLVNDQAELMASYMHRNAGRVALAQATFTDPSTGRVLINGINSDKEWDALLTQVQKAGAELVSGGHVSATDISKEIESLKWAYDRIVGRPLTSQQGTFAESMRLLRKTQIARLANVGLFQQTAEIMTGIGTVGLRSWMQHAPGVRRIFGGELGLREAKRLYDEIHSLGMGVENVHQMHGWAATDFDRAADLAATGRSAKLDNVNRGVDAFNNAVLKGTGMHGITDMSQTAMAAAMAQNIFHATQKAIRKGAFSRSFMNKMRQLNLDEEMLTRIGKELSSNTNVRKVDGVFGPKVGSLAFDTWADKEAGVALQNAMFRASRKAIQSGDIGMMRQWMSEPLQQTLLQFKSFAMMGWANHTLYAAHHFDANTAAGLMAAFVFGGTLYAAQAQIRNWGKNDGGAQLRKDLAPSNLALQAFQRTGASSILPNLVDSTIPHLTGSKPLFDQRNSGTSSSFFSPPIYSTGASSMQGIGALAASTMNGTQMSQQDIKSLISIVPFANFTPVQGLFINPLIANRPEFTRKPKGNALEYILGEK